MSRKGAPEGAGASFGGGHRVLRLVTCSLVPRYEPLVEEVWSLCKRNVSSFRHYPFLFAHLRPSHRLES